MFSGYKILINFAAYYNLEKKKPNNSVYKTSVQEKKTKSLRLKTFPIK